MQETQEMQVQSLGQEEPLEEKMATHSSILAWKIPCTESLEATVHGITESDMTETHTGARAIHICFRVTLILKFEHQIIPRSMLIVQEKTIFIVTQIPWYVLHIFSLTTEDSTRICLLPDLDTRLPNVEWAGH